MKAKKNLSRYLEKPVTSDLKKKMIFIAGPRQAGKTWLAKKILRKSGQDIKTRYMNWDALEDRENILKGTFPSGKGCLVLDEIRQDSMVNVVDASGAGEMHKQQDALA